jgi:hypothetical protein
MLFTQNGARIIHSFYAIAIGINKYGLSFPFIRFVIIYWMFFETVVNKYLFPPAFRREFLEDGKNIEHQIRQEIKRLEKPDDEKEDDDWIDIY